MAATYFVSSCNGSEANDGLAASSAVDSWRRLSPRPGDTILFERGSSFRETIVSPDGEPGRPVTWGAYGSGSAPAFYGSVDLSDPAIWESEGRNVWRCTRALEGEVANLVFDDGREYGVLAWKREDMFKPGHWHFTHVGFLKDERVKRAVAGTTPALYLYSHGNPGERWRSIECSLRGGSSFIATGRRHIVVENIAFLYAPVTAFTVADGEDITIRGCLFKGTGGLVHTHGAKIGRASCRERV